MKAKNNHIMTTVISRFVLLISPAFEHCVLRMRTYIACAYVRARVCADVRTYVRGRPAVHGVYGAGVHGASMRAPKV